MNSSIERPLFYEGEILGAADLTTGAEYLRGQVARHERHLHLWGIAFGLFLKGEDKQTDTGATYQDITLSAGSAIDGTGREIVVSEDKQLPDDVFDQSNVATTDIKAWYPVFLMGADQAASEPQFTASACGDNQPTQIHEGYEILFGRPGDELEWENQQAPPVDGGPGNRAWRVLIGFVQWNADLRRFTAAADEYGGIGRRYAGVQADVVAARAGRLTLRTETEGQAGKPAILLDENNKDGLLQFGLLTDTGGVTPLLSVNDKGDLTVPGTISGVTAAGTVKVESGIATDGMVLPIPAGVTERQVADGQAVIHVHISLQIRLDDSPKQPGSWTPFPLESFVDDQRRVHCLVRWLDLSSKAVVDQPSYCLYTVVASVT